MLVFKIKENKQTADYFTGETYVIGQTYRFNYRDIILVRWKSHEKKDIENKIEKLDIIEGKFYCLSRINGEPVFSVDLDDLYKKYRNDKIENILLNS